MKSFFASAAIAALAFAGDEAALITDDASAVMPDEKGEGKGEWEREYSSFERDLEDFYEDLNRDLDDIVEYFDRDPKEFTEEAMKEAQRELEREIERAMEDLECNWSDWFGDGSCARRDRDAEMYSCWHSEVEPRMTWDWEENECITEDEY